MALLTAGALFLMLATAFAALAWVRSRPQRARLTPDGIQEASILVCERYRPSVVVVRCGIPLRLMFTRNEDSPCSQRVIFPDFGISRSLPARRTTAVDIMPHHEGEFLFTCAMGMYQGMVIVTAQRQRGIDHMRAKKK